MLKLQSHARLFYYCVMLSSGAVNFAFFPTQWLHEHCTLSHSSLPSVHLSCRYWGHLPKGSLGRDRSLSDCCSIYHEALHWTEEPASTLKTVAWAPDSVWFRYNLQAGLSWLPVGDVDFPNRLHALYCSLDSNLEIMQSKWKYCTSLSCDCVLLDLVKGQNVSANHGDTWTAV